MTIVSKMRGSHKQMFFAVFAMLVLSTTDVLAANDDALSDVRISLITLANDKDHLEQSLRQLIELTQLKNIKIGEVLTVGLEGYAPLQQQGNRVTAARDAPTRFFNHLSAFEQVGLDNYEILPATRYVEKLKLEYSPTWIVRYRGRDYVFEGFQNPQSLFTRNGQFLKAE